MMCLSCCVEITSFVTSLSCYVLTGVFMCLSCCVEITSFVTSLSFCVLTGVFMMFCHAMLDSVIFDVFVKLCGDNVCDVFVILW